MTELGHVITDEILKTKNNFLGDINDIYDVATMAWKEVDSHSSVTVVNMVDEEVLSI